MEIKTIDQSDASIIKDAVRLLKSQFVELYVTAGFDSSDTALAWHKIRTSSKGRLVMEKEYAGIRHIQAKTFISSINDELKQRKMEPIMKIMKNTDEVAVAPKAKQKVVKAKAPKVVKEKKVAAPKTDAPSDRGNKTAIAKQLIVDGETNAIIISEKSGAAVAYVRTLLYNYRKSQKG
jgi:hypothetical protein